ncbi:hypothetical protein RRG08_021412 [Elysia crispata]|uniref:Uncharacterized protein n=1 Tax=Elysia crispata TaxID=231223 RepID=A0AAE1A791_9GAST|nr:hypothetical protein RRG08_021412 [Elysia crispata]
MIVIANFFLPQVPGVNRSKSVTRSYILTPTTSTTSSPNSIFSPVQNEITRTRQAAEPVDHQLLTILYSSSRSSPRQDQLPTILA